VFDWSVQRGAQDEVASASSKAAGGRRKVVQEDEGEPRTSDRQLRSHTRQMQATTPGAVGQQRAAGARREGDLW